VAAEHRRRGHPNALRARRQHSHGQRAEIEALAGSNPSFAAWEQNESYTIALLLKGRSGGASTKHLYRSGSSSTGDHILWLSSGTTPNLRHQASGGGTVTITSAAGAADIVDKMREVSSSGQFQIDAFERGRSGGHRRRARPRGPYTIFAPTNEAFRTLKIEALKPGGPAQTPEEQLESANQDQLSEILKQHIVEGRTPFDQLIEQGQLEPLQGAKLEVSHAKGGVLVNDIEILKPDINSGQRCHSRDRQPACARESRSNQH